MAKTERYLDLGGGRIDPNGDLAKHLESYECPWTNTPDEPEWSSINIHKESNPTHLCDVVSMPFEDNTFDLIRGLFFPAHALSWESLREIVRVLKPNGLVDIITGRNIMENEDWARDFIISFAKSEIYSGIRYVGKNKI